MIGIGLSTINAQPSASARRYPHRPSGVTNSRSVPAIAASAVVSIASSSWLETNFTGFPCISSNPCFDPSSCL